MSDALDDLVGGSVFALEIRILTQSAPVRKPNH